MRAHLRRRVVEREGNLLRFGLVRQPDRCGRICHPSPLHGDEPGSASPRFPGPSARLAAGRCVSEYHHEQSHAPGPRPKTGLTAPAAALSGPRTLPATMTACHYARMLTVALVSQKGGAGKTTIAINLAIASELAGRPAVVVDLDPQASAATWADSRAAEAPVVVSAQAARLSEVLATRPRARGRAHPRRHRPTRRGSRPRSRARRRPGTGPLPPLRPRPASRHRLPGRRPARRHPGRRGAVRGPRPRSARRRGPKRPRSLRTPRRAGADRPARSLRARHDRRPGRAGVRARRKGRTRDRPPVRLDARPSQPARPAHRRRLTYAPIFTRRRTEAADRHRRRPQPQSRNPTHTAPRAAAGARR